MLVASGAALPPVARAEAKHRIAEPEDSHQLAVGFVAYDEAEPAAVTGGHRDAPVQASVPEQKLVFALRLHDHESRSNAFGVDVTASRDVSQEAVFVSR